MMKTSRSAEHGRAWPCRAAWIVLGLLVWVARLQFPSQIAGEELDLSWARALGWALTHRLQHGVDIVFTYGPLGFFASSVYDPDLHWIKLVVWEGAFKLLLALLLASAALRIRSWIERGLFAAVLIALPLDPDGYFFLSMLAAALLALEEPRRRDLLGAVLLALAVLASVKFTLLVLALACVTCIAIARWRAIGARAGLSAALVFAILLAAVWIVCGQSLLNAPHYVWASLEISRGYSEAMSIEGSSDDVLLASGALAITGALAAALALARPRAIARALVAIVFAAAAFTAFKSGYVRGSDHTIVFFSFFAAAPLVLSTPEAWSRPARLAAAVARIAALSLALLGFFRFMEKDGQETAAVLGQCGRRLVNNVDGLVEARGFQILREQELARLRKIDDLPRTREIAGGATIDIWPHQQGLIFLNGLQWRPRPVFQSYAAFTEDLQALDARFLESDRAPQFVLFQLATFDDRLPPMDDAQALAVIVRDYTPVLYEHGFLLLRHVPREGAREPREAQLAREAAFDEIVDVSALAGSCHVMSLDIRYTLWGRLRTFLDKAPPLLAELRTNDGAVKRVRIVPGMVKSGVIVDPLLLKPDDAAAWYGGFPLPRLASIRVLAPASPAMYAPAFSLRILRADDLVPRPVKDMEAILDLSMFATRPIAFDLPYRGGLTRVAGQDVYVVHTPSSLRFRIGVGEHTVRGCCGLTPQSYLKGKTDGATFRVTIEREGAPARVAFERTLDPMKVKADRGLVPFEAKLDIAPGETLFLRTDPGPAGNTDSDWAFWSQVRIEDARGRLESGD